MPELPVVPHRWASDARRDVVRHRLLIPDLPGAGSSDHPDVYLGPHVLARARIALVDALGIRGATVIGNSMGGYLCMRAALLDVREMRRFVRALERTPFPIPLCLVYAQRDPMVPPSVGQKLRALVPSAQFIELAEASHFAHVDAAGRFVAAVEPWLSSG